MRPVAVVAHMHWDREWYDPLEILRPRLVAAVNSLVETMDRDPRWESFMLDGQMAMVDDYLAASPGSRDRVAGLVGSGRLSVGPWYVLMDEFCVSAETMVRNLQLGMERASSLGATEFVGYLPDMFGHAGQMPQILRQAGIEQAVVWRGVPASITRTGFLWTAPDGSEVRAEYLPVGYANGAFLPQDPAALLRRVDALVAEAGGLLGGAEEPILLMNGTDHQAVQPWVPALLEAANAAQERYRFTLTSLPRYLAGLVTEGLPAWTGELRSGYRAPILMGTLSNRADVKAAAAAAEQLLERLAEPLAALWLGPQDWPAERLSEAWLEVIRNSAHDSVCACSADEVGRAVLHRYDRAASIARTIVEDVADLAALATDAAGPVVLNPSAQAREATIELTLPGTSLPEGCQLLHRIPSGSEVRTGDDLARIIGELVGDGWLGEGGRCTGAAVTVDPDSRVALDLSWDPSGRSSPEAATVLAEAWAQAGAHREHPLVVRVERASAVRVAARSGLVPGYGWSVWEPVRPSGAVTASALGLSNGLVSVEVDTASGTFSVSSAGGGRVEGLDRLVDGGDAGDTYNYCPPEEDLLVDEPDSVAVDVLEQGPVRGRLRLHRRYNWPARLSGGRRHGSVPVQVSTELEVNAGEGVVRITTAFDNPARDHRLRSVFPLPEPASETEAGCAFASVRRRDAEGGPREPPLPTFPARGFVSAGGLTLLHEGLREYELVDDGRALAVTLLRATGILSRPTVAARPNVAGPPTTLQDTQMIGPHRAAYAVVVGPVDAWQLSEATWVPFLTVDSAGGGALPRRGTRLEVSGAQVSSLRRQDGRLEVRLFNPTEGPSVVTLARRSGRFVDLRGRPTGIWNESFELRPWGMATIVIDS